jgi:hypothetical protein
VAPSQSLANASLTPGFLPGLTLAPDDTSAPSATDLVGAAATGLATALAVAADQLTPRLAVAAAEAVSARRSALYQCLIDLGWTPPVGVVDGMALDARLLSEGLGAGYDGEVR